MDGKGKARGVFGIILVLGALILRGPGVSFGGDLEPTAGPGEQGTYTLQHVYDRLDTGAAGTLSTATAPSAGPADSSPTVNEIMGKAPVVDDTDGATESDVAEGKTFWGLSSGQWGPSTGSLAAETVENDTVQQAGSIYEAFDLSTIEKIGTRFLSTKLHRTFRLFPVGADFLVSRCRASEIIEYFIVSCWQRRDSDLFHRLKIGII